MNHRKLITLILCGFFGVCSPHIQSQQRSVSNDEQIADERIREKAFALLEAVAGQLGNLQSVENRARIGSNLVDALWNHDEKRSRTLLVAVENDIRTGLQNRVSEDLRDKQTSVFLHLRVDTVERVAKHDAELALSFLRNTNAISEKRSPFRAESEDLLELRLAKQIAAENPDLALRIGRESLERNFQTDLLQVLLKLRRKHSDKASVLFRDIIAKLRQTNLGQDWNAAYFARNLAVSFAPPLAEDSTYRELVGVLITSALSNGCSDKNPSNGGFCVLMASLRPQMEKTDPARAAQLKSWSGAPSFDYGQMNVEVEEAVRNGAVDEILEVASKYPDFRRNLYQRAVSQALSSGDIEHAQRIAKSYDGNPEEQVSLLGQITEHQNRAGLNDEKLTEVQRTLNAVPNPQARLFFLLQFVNQVGPSNPKTALVLLDQANGIAETMNPGHLQTQSQVAVAILYCLFKSDRGFTIMESLVPKLNELISAAAKLDGFDTNYLREGEWNMSAEGNLGQTLTVLSRHAGAFAWRDFDRAVSLSAQFERPEIRLMAQLKLAQGILAGQSRNLSYMPLSY